MPAGLLRGPSERTLLHGPFIIAPNQRKAQGAACGGPIGIVNTGDEIEIDALKNTISLNIPDAEYKARMDAFTPKGPGEKRGVLGKYAKLVASASEGAVTDKYL